MHHRALQLLFVAVSMFSVPFCQSFVPPQEACLIINPCKHSGVPECGRDSKDLSTRLFRDDCDMVEHNCYKNQEYHKVDINECNNTNSKISTNKYTTTVVLTTVDDNMTDTTLLSTKALQTSTDEATTEASTYNITNTTKKESLLTSTPKSSKKPILTTQNLASTISRSALTSQFNKSTTQSSASQKSTTINSTTLDATTLKSTPVTCKSLTTSLTSLITPKIASSTLPNIFVYIKNIYMLRGSNISPNIVPTILPTLQPTSISPNNTKSTASSTALSTNEIKNKTSSTKAKTTTTYSTKAAKISTKMTRHTEKNNITKINSNSTKRNYISSTTSTSPNVTETINETTASQNNSSHTNCDGYPNDCKRPQTWETTAKGETRDFFQVLRDRFGDKVKYLDDTTHFPKRRVNTVNNFLQSFVLGDHNES